MYVHAVHTRTRYVMAWSQGFCITCTFLKLVIKKRFSTKSRGSRDDETIKGRKQGLITKLYKKYGKKSSLHVHVKMAE